MNTEGLWEKFLASLEEKVNPMTYNTWFKPLELLKIDNEKNLIIVKVPMAVHISILSNKWYSLILWNLHMLNMIFLLCLMIS